MAKVILHVDMDAFFAAIEQRDNPALRGRPVVVGAGPHERGVVAAASYEARRYGIHSAMSSRMAGRLCPSAVFLPADHNRYESVSRQVFEILNRFTPLIEPLSLDEAFLDVTGARTLFGDGPSIARAIKEAIRSELSLTASVGVAHNMFLAKIASDMNKPDGLTVVPSDEAEVRAFLAPLPVTRIFGVGKTTAAILHKAGILAIGDLQKTPLPRLVELLGERNAAHIAELAAGRDARKVEPEQEEKSFSREYTFPADCADIELLRATLEAMSAEVAARLRNAGKRASLCRIKVRMPDFSTFTRQKRMVPPRCDDFSLCETALELFEPFESQTPLRLLGVGAGELSGMCREYPELFSGKNGFLQQRRERLCRSMDALRARFGERSIGTAAALKLKSAKCAKKS